MLTAACARSSSERVSRGGRASGAWCPPFRQAEGRTAPRTRLSGAMWTCTAAADRSGELVDHRRRGGPARQFACRKGAFQGLPDGRVEGDALAGSAHDDLRYPVTDFGADVQRSAAHQRVEPDQRKVEQRLDRRLGQAVHAEHPVHGNPPVRADERVDQRARFVDRHLFAKPRRRRRRRGGRT